MAHGKETPRQKMIGMMYLFLTMMLALNVSSEVLKAFELIDQSLVKSANNTKSKNEIVYSEFQKAYEENKAKVEKWKKKADDVKLKSQEIIDTIQNYKRKIVQIADAIPAESWNDSLFHHIQKKDNMDVPAQVMILWKNGSALRKKLNDLREQYVHLVDDTIKGESVVRNIRANIVTTDQVDVEGRKKPWENTFFENLPLAAVIANLSKIQSDIRNTESDVLSYLFGQISASDFKFNKLEAVVKAPSSYILKGGTYEAEVFIAASDTTIKPEIYVGSTLLPNKEGKGVYKATASDVGPKSFGGVIKYKGPDGVVNDYKFKADYEVGAPSLVVSPTKMNVFYIGVPNPVAISVSGVPEEKISPFISGGYGGLIRKGSGGEWIVTVTQPTPKGKFVQVGATAEIGGEKKNMGAENFRVKTVPDPVAKVGKDSKNWRGGPINQSALLAESGVYADLENFDFDLVFNITEFEVSATLAGGFEDVAPAKSSRFTPQQKALIQKVARGKKVRIENVKAVGPDKKVRDLGSISFTIK